MQGLTSRAGRRARAAGRVLLFMGGVVALSGAGSAALAQQEPHGGMLRYPDVSGSHIVFVYANDLWLVSRGGGVAIPLASPPGEESFAKFSPDGKTIAFIGNYDGNRDIYTLPIIGGVPERVSYRNGAEWLCDWKGDDELIFYAWGMGRYPRAAELFTVAADGGLPEKIGVPYGANASVAPDGDWMAYTLHSRDRRTWKRYRGGMATDIWLFNLRTNESKKITDWEGTDTLPMWQGQTVYYLSDGGPNHRLNIWAYNTTTDERRQVTAFDDFDVKWPSIGPGQRGAGEIIFQHGAELKLLDLGTEKVRAVNVQIPGDKPTLRPQRESVGGLVNEWEVSPSGKRMVAAARGDIWTLPAKHGSPRNLTRTSGVAERDPAWSPDGESIAYFSDATGEYELYIRRANGRGEPEQVTQGGKTFYYAPLWSPDSKRICFVDKAGKIYLYTRETGETKLIDTDPWADQVRVSWSGDSNWIAYARTLEKSALTAIFLYDVAGEALHQVTAGMFSDSSPAFDRKGDYLYFASDRDFSNPIYEDYGSTWVYANTSRLYCVPLRDDVDSPLLAKSDEEGVDEDDADKSDDAKDDDKGEDEDAKGDDADSDDDNGHDADNANDDDEGADDADDDGDEDEADDSDEDEEEVEPWVIDLDGFEHRAVMLPIERGRFGWLAVNDGGKLLYVRRTSRGVEGDPAIKIVDPSADEIEEEDVLDGFGAYVLTADGKKLLAAGRGRFVIVDAAKGQKADEPIETGDMDALIDPRAEWKQMLVEAWRVQRDFFYDPHMHGVDWEAVRDQYAAMLPDCVSREDLSYVIREMISEINVGHAYYWGGDTESEPRTNVGSLGCDFALVDGAYQISRILEGAVWDVDARGPLSQPGVDAKAGDFLLAINGVPLDASKSPYAALQGLAGQVVTLTLSDDATWDDEDREVVVELLGGDGNLRYRAWIEHNRRYVDEQTDGKVGYIYVPDTGVNGQNNLVRQFYGQTGKAALIIDERWNGGGQIPDRFVELLNRPIRNYWARRDGNDWPWPADAQYGPKCMLINGLAGSGGDAFPAYFKQSGVGKLIGTRTWGGLVGISGNPGLIDGGYTSAPTFAYYDTDGTWGIEGHGVDPDIEVIDDPATMVGGRDPQLDAAIKLMLEEIKRNGYQPPKRPAYPDRSGMGIREADK